MVNTRKIYEISGNIIGGLIWGLFPVAGATTNYAVTATDEVGLLFAYVLGEGLGNLISTNHPLTKNILAGSGDGALGLLAWDLGQQMFTKTQLHR
jgi:hypothetical protein